MNKITALPVERDEMGQWCHPALDALCGEREFVPSYDFRQWVDANDLEFEITAMGQDEPSPALDEWYETGSFAAWQPEPPAGEGWFIAAIYDTGDGPVCIWFRSVEGAAA